MVTGNISLRDEGLGHPPGQPPKPAEVLFVHDWSLEWITGGRRENTFQLLPQGGLLCQGPVTEKYEPLNDGGVEGNIEAGKQRPTQKSTEKET